MSIRNQVKILGNLVREPEVRVTKNNKKVVYFSIAINKRFKNKETGTWEEKEPIFMNVTAWGFIAEKAMTLHKGMGVVIDGVLEDNSYTNKEGKTIHEKRVRANDIYLQIKIKQQENDKHAWDENNWTSTSI